VAYADIAGAIYLSMQVVRELRGEMLFPG
jgi:hypothetical protein